MMKKLILLLSVVVTHCSAGDKQQKPTIACCYSSSTSKRIKHEITLSDGTCITLTNSLIEPKDTKVTISHKKLPEVKK